MEKNVKVKDIIKISFWVVLIIVTGVNIFYLARARGKLVDQERAVEEQSKPPEFVVTYIKDENCENCFDIEMVEKEITTVGGVLSEVKSVDFTSEEGKSIIEKYDIKKVPAALIEGDLNKNQQLADLWPQIGFIEEGVFVLTYIFPPYIDLETNEKVGEFDIVFLTDQTCDKCYDVTLHQNALDGMAMKSINQTIVDMSTDRGKQYIKDYKIEKIPTIILSGDLESYEHFKGIWEKVGTKEEDGSYVFRTVEIMGDYKEVKSGKVVNTRGVEE